MALIRSPLPSSLSPDTSNFLAKCTSGTDKSLMQSPIMYVSSPSERSPSDVLFSSGAATREDNLSTEAEDETPLGCKQSPEELWDLHVFYKHHHEQVDTLRRETLDLRQDNLNLKQALHRGGLPADMHRENSRLQRALEESMHSINLLEQPVDVSTSETWHVARVEESRSQVRPRFDASSVMKAQKRQIHFMQKSVNIKGAGTSQPVTDSPLAHDAVDIRSQSPTNTSILHLEMSRARVQRELEQANNARDDLIETVQMQSEEIVHLRFRLSQTLEDAAQIPEQNLGVSLDAQHMNFVLDSTRAELDQSLIAREDLLW